MTLTKASGVTGSTARQSTWPALIACWTWEIWATGSVLGGPIRRTFTVTPYWVFTWSAAWRMPASRFTGAPTVASVWKESTKLSGCFLSTLVAMAEDRVNWPQLNFAEYGAPVRDAAGGLLLVPHAVPSRPRTATDARTNSFLAPIPLLLLWEGSPSQLVMLARAGQQTFPAL